MRDLADNASHGEYGTRLQRTTIAATQFQPRSTSANLHHLGSGYGYLPSASGGDGYYLAPVEVPDGALLCYIGLYAYDVTSSSSGHLFAMLTTYYGGFQAIAGNSTTIPATSIGVSAKAEAISAGIGYEFAAAAIGGSGTLGFPNCVTVNNDVLHGGNQYAINVYLDPAADTAQQFRAVELAWYRQISPAPASASFTDVLTTDSFFQEIEAMKASGITTGCGGTSFCPNANVTRGQMAAFLARALGL
jgi:hypothetical protein